jgi:hypothetical protein
MTIIFAFKGPGHYLQYTVKQAYLASRRHRVICLTDYDPAPGFCEWHKWDDYAEGVTEFEALLEGNSHFERTAFSRALVIYNFCKAHSISRYFNADWDVVITTDLGRVCDMWSWTDFTMSMCKEAKHALPDGRVMPVGHASHAMVTIRALKAFIAFSRKACRQRRHGCEMLIWTEFAYLGGMRWADTADALDHNLGSQLDEYHNLEFEACRYKWIDWVGGKPHKVRFDGRREFMPIIHCWSGSKGMIPEFCNKLQEGKNGSRGSF